MVTGLNSGKSWLYRWRRKLATAGTSVLLAVIGYHAFFGANGLMVYEQKRRESDELDRQIKTLQQQNSGMEQQIKALKSDPKTIEKEARQSLRYARPGEVIYTLPAAPVAPSQQASQQQK